MCGQWAQAARTSTRSPLRPSYDLISAPVVFRRRIESDWNHVRENASTGQGKLLFLHEATARKRVIGRKRWTAFKVFCRRQVGLQRSDLERSRRGQRLTQASGENNVLGKKSSYDASPRSNSGLCSIRGKVQSLEMVGTVRCVASGEQTVCGIDSIVPAFDKTPRPQLPCGAKAAVKRCERFGRHC